MIDSKKGIVIILLVTFILVVLFFINNNTDDRDVSLSDFFALDENMVYSFEGTSEYSHVIMLQEVINKQDFKQFTYKGYLTEGIGPIDFEGNERDFLISYKVYDDKVLREDKSGERVVLKTPLKEGTTWDTDVIINNEKFSATSKITELKNGVQDGENIIRCVVETEVNLGSNFNNQVYLKRAVYEVGKGLVFLEKPIFMNDNTSINFNYALMNIKKKEIFLEFLEGLKKEVDH